MAITVDNKNSVRVWTAWAQRRADGSAFLEVQPGKIFTSVEKALSDIAQAKELAGVIENISGVRALQTHFEKGLTWIEPSVIDTKRPNVVAHLDSLTELRFSEELKRYIPVIK